MFSDTKRLLLIIGLCLSLVIVSSCSQQEYYTMEGNSVTWQNDYGLINVTPHTCHNAVCTYEADITMLLPSQDYDFAFRFAEQLVNPSLYEWKNISHNILNNETQQVEEVYFYEWIDRTNAFTMDTYEGYIYYWVADVGFIQDETKKYRWQFNKPSTDGKWELLAKRSSESLESAISNEHYIILDPWYTEGDPLGNWALNGDNQNPYAIGANNTHLWVTDVSDDEVYKYARDGTSIGIWGGTTGKPIGITIDNTYIWTTDQDTQRVYKYNMDGGAISDWACNALNGQPQGLAGNGTHLWNLDGADDRVYKYKIDGTYIDYFSLYAENSGPWGLTTDNEYIWVNDNADGIVYKYEMDGTYLSNWSLDLPSNDAPTGIAYNELTGENASFFTVDYTDADAYEYDRAWLSPGLTINVSISPDPAYSNSTLNCSALLKDPTVGNNINATFSAYNNSVFYDSELQTEIANGSTVSTTSIFSSTLKVGDIWNCTVFAIDATDASINKTESVIVTISNSAPSFNHSPVSWDESHTINISIDINATDIDSDTLIYSIANLSADLNTPLAINNLTGLINYDPVASETGNYSYNLSCTDGTANVYQILNISISNTAPSFNHSPVNSSEWHSTNISIDINCTDADLDTLSYSIANLSADLDTPLTIGNLTGLINYDPSIFEVGNYSYNLSCSDGASNVYQILNISVNQNLINVTSSNKDKGTAGSTIIFYLKVNITDVSTTPTDVYLILNNTNYTSPVLVSSDNGSLYQYNYSKEVTLLQEDGNATGMIQGWNWTYTIEDVVTDYSTGIKNITVYSIEIDNCSTYNYSLINLTLLEEELQTKLTNSTEIETAINIYDITGEIRMFNYSGLSNTNPSTICMNSELFNDPSYYLNAIVRYKALGYENEYYNIQNSTLTNNTAFQNINLYDLNTTDSTEFRLTFTGSDFSAVEDALIYLDRQYIAENVFKTVELPKTDSNGQTVLHMVRNDVIYNIRVVKNNEVLGTFNNLIAFCDDFTIGDCKIDLNAFDTGEQIFDYSSDLGILFTGPRYNTTTDKVVFDFITYDGTSKLIEMVVTRSDIFGNRTVCTTEVESPSGRLTCDIDENVEDTDLGTSISVDGSFAIFNVVKLDPTNYGTPGYLVFFILIFSFILLFSESKSGVLIGIVLAVAGGIGLGMITGDLIGVGASGLWIIIIAGIGLWKLNKMRIE